MKGALLALLLPLSLGADHDPDWLAVLVDRVAPSVVNLHTAGVRQPRSAWDAMFGGPERFESLGSGFVVDAERGLIATNAHVVAGASEVQVLAWDGKSYDADVLGADAGVDLALLRVRGLGLPEVAFGDSRKLRVGAAVFAVGNPYGHGHTVTQGILSARARALGRERFDLFLQTDAAINPGNSGGPLFDSSGRVVGITTAIDGRGEALGFAMPIELVRGAMAFLERGEAVEPGWAGLSLHQGDDGTLRIAAVMPQSPAARAGLQVGDRIVSVDARTMLGRAAWAEAFEVTFPGERRTLVVDRSQRNETAEIVLEARSAWEKRIVPPPREVAAFGIAVRDLAPDVRYTLGIAGQQVVRADKGAPFATGDVLLAINGSVCDSPDAVIKAAEQAMQTRTFTADVLREGQRIRIARRW